MIPLGRLWLKKDANDQDYLEGFFEGSLLISRNKRKLNRVFVIMNTEKKALNDPDWILCFDKVDKKLTPTGKTPAEQRYLKRRREKRKKAAWKKAWIKRKKEELEKKKKEAEEKK